MELIGGLFTTLIGGGGAAAAETAVAGTAAAATSGGLTALQWITGTASAVASIGAGVAGAAEAEAEAKQQDFASRDEFIAGKEESARLKAELARTVGNQAVAFAAGGADLGSVSVGQARDQAVKDAERELSISSSEALSRSLQRRRAAANARSRGASALFRGVTGGLTTIGDTAIDVLQRG